MQYDTLVRNGESTEIAKIPIKDGKYSIIVPRTAVQENGKLLVEKNGIYHLVQNEGVQFLDVPGDAVMSYLKKDAALDIKAERISQDVKIPVPKIKKGRVR